MKWLLKAYDLQDRFYEWCLEIRTRGFSKSKKVPSHFEDGVPYEYIPYFMLSRIFKEIRISPRDEFLDYGCGKGRVIAFAARFPFKEVIGVEVDAELINFARKNSQTLRGKKAPITLIEQDARDFDPKEATVLFFFNPFGEKTMEAVLEKIRESLSLYPRSLTLIYFNPVHSKLLNESGWLKLAKILRIKLPGSGKIQREARVEFYET